MEIRSKKAKKAAPRARFYSENKGNYIVNKADFEGSFIELGKELVRQYNQGRKRKRDWEKKK